MYIFNKITVNPQLPKRIGKISEISNNLWWSWNTDFLRLFQIMDKDLWEICEKNPVKFLKQVSQDRLEDMAKNTEFLKDYDIIAREFEDYMASKNTWFSNNYQENKNDLIAYFSAEYGLDRTIPIYSGGLGILSGDHLKSASDLGIPLVAVGLLYKNGYFHQKINGYGNQESEYHNIELGNLPINPAKDENGEEIEQVKDVNLRVVVGEDTIYSQKVKASETAISAGNAIGTGTTTVKVYINDVLKNTNTLNYSSMTSYLVEKSNI